VKLDVQPDISWMTGLSYGAWVVTQALQQVRFGMNEHGARVVVDTAVGATRGGAHLPHYYTLDGAFRIVIVRQEMENPIFVGHVTEEDWKDPGDLRELKGDTSPKELPA
jgi:hypothetical protein